MSDVIQSRARQVRRRLNVLLTLRQCLQWTAAALLGIAGLCFVLRAWVGLSRGQAAWLFLLLIPALVGASRQAFRAGWSRVRAMIWLDLQAGGRGSIVTAVQCPDVRWQPTFASELATVDARPTVAWRRALHAWVPAALTCAAMFWVDFATPMRGHHQFLEIAHEETQEQLATLQEVADLEDEQELEWERRLQRIRDDLDTALPATTLEALDRVADELRAEAEVAAQQANQAMVPLQLVRAEGATESALQQSWETLAEAGLLHGLPEEFVASMQAALGGQSMALTEDAFQRLSLSPELKQALQRLPAISLTEEQWAELADQIVTELAEEMQKLLAAGLIAPQKFQFGVSHQCDEHCQTGVG